MVLPSMSEQSFPLVCLFLVMSVGVSHGALDYLKGHEVLKTFERAQIKTFYVVYAAFACIIVGIWYLSPFALLTTFLLLAAYHFGKEDSEFAPGTQRGFQRVLYLLKGSAITMAPLTFHPQETETIFLTLNLSVTEILTVNVCSGILILSLLSNILLGWRCARSTLVLLMDFASIVILNWMLHPLVAFSLYFCFLHSIRHSLEMMSEMKGRLAQRLFRFIRQALPLTVTTAVFFVIALYALLSNFSLSESTNKVIFLGLAALTFPHVLLEYLFEARVVHRESEGTVI